MKTEDAVPEESRGGAPGGGAVARAFGPPAELASLLAKLQEARLAHDRREEREAAVSLGKTLVARGAELGTAARLLRHALALGEDAQVRAELSRLMVSLGEHALAAADHKVMVEGRSGPLAARDCLRVGELFARAGQASAAAEALQRGALLDPQSPLCHELLGSLHAWAPTEVRAELASAAFVEAARRRALARDAEGALEDWLRAFEVQPESSAAVEGAVELLRAKGRASAAAELLRAHAAGQPDPADAHARLARQALAEGDLGAALGALLDGGLEGAAIHEAALFDEVLSRAGLLDWLACRLELRAEGEAGRRRAAVYAELSRLAEGPLASPDRALAALVEAVVADPADGALRESLRALAARQHDLGAYVEALLRVVAACTGDRRASALAHLAEIADDAIGDPCLSDFAVSELAACGALDHPSARARLDALAPRVRSAAAALDAARQELARAGGAARLEPLRRLVNLLRWRPRDVTEFAEALEELGQLAPDDRGVGVWLARTAERSGTYERVRRYHASRLGAASRVEVSEARVALAALRRRERDLPAALAEARALLAESAHLRASASVVAVLAAAVGDDLVLADALTQLAVPLSAALKAVVLAAASERRARAGDREGALALASAGRAADPTSTRALAAHVAALGDGADRAVVSAYERVAALLPPRGALAARASSALGAAGEPLLALVWARQAASLRPADTAAIARVLDAAAAAAGDASRVSESIAWAISVPAPAARVAPLVAGAIAKLGALDAPAALVAGRRAIDVLGPRDLALRERAFDAAIAAGDPATAASTLERAVAAGDESPELMMRISRARHAAGDPVGAARALARAAKQGAPGDEVLELAAQIDGAASDARLSLAEARAEACVGLERDVEAWGHLRQLGALRWDLAGDAPAALRAWVRAVEVGPLEAPARFVTDVVAFAGAARGAAELERLAPPKKGQRGSAFVLSLAAAVASAGKLPHEAYRLGYEAISRDPSRAEALAIVETSAQPADAPALASLFDAMAGAAKGAFGRRAVRYRGARALERLGAFELALAQAAMAFEEVPTLGTPYVLLVRLVERAGDSAPAVAALGRVADREPDVVERAAWLHRAADLAGKSREGARARVEVLLRALHVLPDRPTVSAVAEALAALGREAGESVFDAESRFERAAQAALSRVDGPAGARVALAFAVAAMSHFKATRLATSALVAAIDADADMDEYAELEPHLAELARATEGVEAAIERVVALLARPYSNVGFFALRLLALLAERAGDVKTAAKLLVAAKKKEPEDEVLAALAARLAAQREDPELAGAVSAAFPAVDDPAALLARATELAARGEHEDAVTTFERLAWDATVAGHVRTSAFRSLVHSLRVTGRTSTLEAALSREIERAEAAGESGADVSSELVELRAAAGRLDDAAHAGLASLRRDDASPRLVAAALSVARRGVAPSLAAECFGRALEHAAREDRAGLLAELASALEAAGDRTGAKLRWFQLLEREATHAGALDAVERIALQEGDHPTLAAVLAARIAAGGSVEELRVLRLRRAALLEQRLGRLDEARDELTRLCEADDASSLRYLAELEERRGAHAAAARAWARAGALVSDPRERNDVALRTAQAALRAGDIPGARDAVQRALETSRSERLLELRVEIERASADPRLLGEALDELAVASLAAPERRAELLVDAAQTALRAGDEPTALERAQRAARIAPTSSDAQLLARSLEYRARGAGAPPEATQTIEELRRLSGVSADRASLHAFLLAEALDAVQGGNVGMKELSARHAELGDRPLLCLGLAERLLRQGSFSAALPLFDGALGGDLLGLRRRGAVALSAADAAYRVHDLALAERYLAEAASDPSTAHVARQRQTALAAAAESSRHDLVVDERRTLLELVARAVGLDRARALSKLARLLAQNPGERAEADRLLSEALTAAELDPSLTLELEAQRSELRGVPTRTSTPPRASVPPRSSAPPRAAEPRVSMSRPVAPAFPDLRAADSATTAPPPVQVTTPPAAEPPPTPSSAAPATAPVLDSPLTAPPPPAYPPVEAASSPSVHPTVAPPRAGLAALRDAASADRHAQRVKAIDHVIACVTPGATVPEAPPVALQTEQPENVLRLVSRGASTPLGEALALVWESASHLFRREAGAYGVTGLDRIAFGASTPASRVYTAGARLLGAARTPLFQRRATGAAQAEVALLSPPAVILTGDPRHESPELAYRIGASLVAASPERALLLALAPEQLKSLVAALVVAFGPPSREGRPPPTVAVLAESLWQALPARAQRRLRELSSDPAAMSLEVATLSARRVARRAGLFLSGNLLVALRELASELRLPPPELRSEADLDRAAAESAEVADLVQLATSSDFADCRWNDGRARRPSGAFRVG